MINQTTFKPVPSTVQERLRQLGRSRMVVATASALLVAALSIYMLRQPEPGPGMILWVLYFFGAALILYQPRFGIYMTLMFALIGDTNLLLWWPFVVNFSSEWSLFFVHKSLVFSPLELYIVLTAASWLVRKFVSRDFSFFAGRMFLPALGFFVFLVLGLAYGFRAGGNRVIGLSEARPMFYLVTMLIMAGNLIQTREHVNRLVWLAMLGIFIPGVAGVYVYFVELGGDASHLRSVAVHATAVHMNSFFVLIAAAWLYRASKIKRFALPLMALPVLFTYFITQRRAAFLSLFIALALMAILLFRENRKLFFAIVPAAAVFGLAYMLVFWNNTSILGEPVKAVKSIIAPDQVDASDQTSNYYRVIENYNLLFTMRTKPVFGVGFGQPFYVIYALPDISWFEYWQYFPHNSVIYIWLKMGAGGFLVMLFMVSYAIMTGAETLSKFKPEDREMKAIFTMLTLYLLMHFMYAYVDISWDARSMVYVGIAMGLINYFQQAKLPPLPAPPDPYPWLRKENTRSETV